jgi:hypothetical protein
LPYCAGATGFFSSLQKASPIRGIHCNMLFIGDVQNKKHLQSMKNSGEKEGQDDNID